ncbi:bifunctional glutamate--cysteine ligase GshA/glutathione synthetase GshB [Paenibacillus sp. D2_2]|uniref:bifunctional glutamate--cysteine ligase GshA/glutathione synthetase GshB n=1 Tax=Paenibacillus sp. D2_2 TaxID=3073092 RepID=UPI002814ADFE|nr:bifunctional glutamate--cysteine ligase GshA/glutathione synthetase GshB [Paenibacillus sp. D2_2]WMT43258.1 bifunctional glutamate--cysteine ligase GshA/glutathione synthetase GshB [Paenibacillus sp. D2_2]
MIALDHHFIDEIIREHLQEEVFKGHFGLEKENARVDRDGKLALSPHPAVFGDKLDHPYIKTDFSESQIEMITPVLNSTEEAYHFLETLHDIVTLELKDEYLWTSSNPPKLPTEEEIPIAKMNDPEADQYRMQLAEKYGRKKQLLSGIHINFSFQDSLLNRLHQKLDKSVPYKEFKDEMYLKVARNIIRYRWLLIYLTGASPVFDKTYVERCVHLSHHLDDESHYFPYMNSLRNSMCGYRNQKPYYVSFNTVNDYVQDIRQFITNKQLLSAKELYSSLRLKTTKGEDMLTDLIEHGIEYIELRMIDLNPLSKIGIHHDTLQFIHLFIVFSLFLQDEPLDLEEQKQAHDNVDQLLSEGIKSKIKMGHTMVSMEALALEILDSMMDLLNILKPGDTHNLQVIEQEKKRILNPQTSYASIVKSEIEKSSYSTYHLNQAKLYAKQSLEVGYTFAGYEDLELSTQLLLKAAIKRGIRFEILDRDENFIRLQKGDQIEYVKQATKTSLDSYSTVLIMENKIVTKEVLRTNGIRVPDGEAYANIEEAMSAVENYLGRQIVIKPKSTNFGLGISIFTNEFSREDYRKAFELAFEYDRTVLLEEFMSGKEYRFLVMGDEVVGILHRVPANVLGDGIHTITQLIHEKNKDPLRGKGYKTPLERIQWGDAEQLFLKGQGRSLEDVPASGEIVYLRENSNISTGGDSIDYTDDIPDSYKQFAIKSAKAAGATICGVDMMIDDIRNEATQHNYSIIEINFNPAIHIHCYPYKGKNRKADDKILDLLFEVK